MQTDGLLMFAAMYKGLLLVEGSTYFHRWITVERGEERGEEAGRSMFFKTSPSCLSLLSSTD